MMKKARLMIVSEGYGKNFYGVAQMLLRLISFFRGNDFLYKVIVANKGEISEEEKENVVIVPTYRASRMLRWHYGQKQFFIKQIDNFSPDIIHVHGIFTFVQRVAIQVAKEKKIPCLISAHGMLEPWLWEQKGVIYFWLKKLYWNVLLRPVLRKADYVHAITEEESDTLTKEFPGIPQVRISNAIDINEYSSNQTQPDDKYLLFIGRLHPVKAVDLLIKSFQNADIIGFHLVIAGPDFDVEYTLKLKSLVAELGLSERIFFIGAVYGEQKSKLLRKAWCTVVPSYSEVIAMVNLESAASYTPTITTYATGLSDWEEGGGLLVEPEIELLTEAITSVCSWSLEERMERGRKSRKLVEQRYSWDVIGEQWIDAYTMIAQSGKKYEQ